MNNLGISISNQKSNKRTTKVRGLDLPFKRFDNIDYNFWSTLNENTPEFLQYLRYSEVREDDVFICTYPRSGTNWTNQIVHMLLTGSSNYSPEVYFLELSEIDMYNSLKSPRVFVTHWPQRFLPLQLKDRGKIICVFRNPKDIAVSLYHFIRSVNMSDFTGTWNEFLRLYLDGDLPGGSWFNYIKEWEKFIQDNKTSSILSLHFENMKKNPLKAIAEMGSFLGVPCDDELFSEISRKCEFNALKKEKIKHVSNFEASFSKDSSNHFLYRKGEVGDWKNWFTVSQNEQFDKVFNDSMKNLKLSSEFE